MSFLKFENEIEIYYSEFGQGTPVIVLHGGLGLDSAYLEKAFRQAAPNWLFANRRFIFLDFRGNGRSAWCASFSLADLVGDVEELRLKLGLGKIVVLGHSFGGLVAQGYALKYPQNLRALILDSTFPVFDFLEDAARIIEEKADARQKKAFGRLLGAPDDDADFREAFLNFLPVYFCEYDERFKAPFAGATQYRAQAFTQGMAILANANMTGELEKIDRPALVLGGMCDIYPVAATARRLHQLIPDSELALFEQSGHFPMIEEPDKYFEIIGAFLNDLTER